MERCGIQWEAKFRPLSTGPVSEVFDTSRAGGGVSRASKVFDTSGTGRLGDAGKSLSFPGFSGTLGG